MTTWPIYLAAWGMSALAFLFMAQRTMKRGIVEGEG